MRTPTSAINRKRFRQNGFTLVELLVVFAMAGLLMAVAPVAYERARDAAQYRSVLRGLMADLRHARQTAMASGVWVAVEFDVQHRHYRAGVGSLRQLPDFLSLRVTTGEALVFPGQIARLYFLPDGGSSGGSVELLRSGAGGARLRVDWLTGHITQEPLLP